jgi:high frequency lysogenization protein
MSFSDQDRLLALGGCFQAAWCVQGIARRGMADSAAMEAAVHSLFQTDAGDVPAVYGGAERVAPGLRQFIAQVKGNRGRDLELSRYVITLMQLERKLSGDNERLQRIASGIETARGRLAHFHLLHPNILGQLADIYSDTISTLQPRIMVNGEPLHLQNPDNQNKIRSLLLAGIRSAMLWYQVGGRRRQILFGRRRLMETATGMLNTIEP